MKEHTDRAPNITLKAMEETETTTTEQTEAPFEAAFEAAPLTEEAVAEAVEEIVAKVESGEAAATSKSVSLEGTVDTLADTVNALADSMASMASTIEVLSAKVAGPVSAGATESVEAPVVESELTDEERAERNATMRRGVIDMLTTGASFFGVGMVAYAAMRHHISILALLVGFAGVVLFAAAAVVRGRSDANGLKSHLRTAGTSALVALGLGLAVGGAIFFGNAPHRAAKLVPVGVAAFAAGFVVRGRYAVAKEHIVWMTGVGVWVALLLTLGLGHIANSVDPAAPTTEPVATAEASTEEAGATEEAAAEAPAAEEAAATEETATTEEAATHEEHAAEEAAATEETATTEAPAAGITAEDAAIVHEATHAAEEAAAAAHE